MVITFLFSSFFQNQICLKNPTENRHENGPWMILIFFFFAANLRLVIQNNNHNNNNVDDGDQQEHRRNSIIYLRKPVKYVTSSTELVWRFSLTFPTFPLTSGKINRNGDKTNCWVDMKRRRKNRRLSFRTAEKISFLSTGNIPLPPRACLGSFISSFF